MKKNTSLLMSMIFCLIAFSSCQSLITHMKKFDDATVAFEPGPLELHGNTVDFTLSATLPSKMQTKKISTFVEVYYQPKNKDAFKLGQFDLKNEELIVLSDGNLKLDKKFSFEYKEGYDVGDLLVLGKAMKREKVKKTVQVILPEDGSKTIIGKK